MSEGFNLVKSLLVIPQLTLEQSFSAIKQIEEFFRNTPTWNRLKHYIMLHVYWSSRKSSEVMQLNKLKAFFKYQL